MQVRELTVMVGSAQPDALAAVYQDVLGLPRVAKYQDPVFEAAGGFIRIRRHSEIQGRSKEPSRVQLNLFVDDVRKEYTRIQAQGVRFVRAPAEESWGGIVATMEDPDGNFVQLIQEPRGE